MSAEPKDGILGRVAKHFFTGVRSVWGPRTQGAPHSPHHGRSLPTLSLRLPRLFSYRCCLSVAHRLRTMSCTPSLVPAKPLAARLTPLTLLHMLPSASEDTHVL